MKRLGGVFTTVLLLLMAGCAVKPSEKVAEGQDRNLFNKADLLGRPLAEVATEERLQSGKPRAKAALPAGIEQLAASLADAGIVVIDVSESYVTISSETDGARKPLLQYGVRGHFDLSAQKTADGVSTQYLVKDTSLHGRWQDRAYVELDPFDPLLIKADEDVLRNLYAVSEVKDRVLTYTGEKDLVWLMPSERAELIALAGLKAGDKLKTGLTRKHFNIFKVGKDGAPELIAQLDARYFDLVRRKNSKDEETDSLVRDADANQWHERLYVELDPESAELVKPSQDLLKNLYEKSLFAGKTFVFGKDLIPILKDNPTLAAELRASAIVPVKDGDIITLVPRRDSVDVHANGRLVAKFSTRSHSDLATDKDADGNPIARLVKNDDKPWAERRYVQVDPLDPDLIYYSHEIQANKGRILRKSELEGQCFAPADLPIAAVRTLISRGETIVEGGAEICVEVTQTVLSVYMKTKGGSKDLVATFDVATHVDIDNVVSADGSRIDGVIAPNVLNPDWSRRAYVVINDNAHVVENRVDPGALAKSLLGGEFIYTATVVASHSENGLVFDGLNLQSPDRLAFEIEDGTLTAYKVNETLNDSRAKSPVLRYSIDQFDIERLKNYYGDRTHIVGETRDAPWQRRSHVRVDFGSNQIPSYFNDMLGIEKLYSGVVFTARSRLAGDVSVDGDLISFETEEVVTPNARSGFSGAGETRYEPVAIRIKHALMKVGARKYVAKTYTEQDFMRFGYFRVTEAGIDPEKGKTDQTLKHYIRRFDIANGKTIDFYLTPAFPAKYLDEVREAVAAWNEAFKAATGRDGVVVLHENEPKDYGDPRFNVIAFIDKRSEMAPLGYGPSVFDPTTGENISAKAFLYGDGIKYVLRQAGDYFDLATGRRKPLEFAVTTEPVVASRGGIDVTRALPRTQAAGRALQLRTQGGSPHRLFNAFKTLETATSLPFAQSLLKGDSSKEMKAVTAEFEAKLQEEAKLSFGSRHQGCAMTPELHLASAIKFVEAYPGKTKAELLAELESRMVFTTLLHEVGHNLGLRHNFHGSFDETNFPAEYHALQAGAPREPGEWAFKYRGSSVMEYSDDFEALYKKAGPYDIAAIKFGYGDKLERVRSVSPTGALVTEDVTLAQINQLVEQRLAADASLTRERAEALVTRALNIRPYKFCTDEHVWNDPTCNRFDRGVTVAEVTQSMVEDYESLYYLYGFRRDRRMFTGGSSYVISRFIMPVRQLLDEYVYRIIFGGFAPQGPESQDDFIDAINAGIGFYEQILATLEPGDYHLDPKTGELVSGRSADEGAKNMVVDLTNGKYLEARVQTIGSSEKVLNRGIELDKLGVLWAMSMRGYPAEKYERASLSLSYVDLLRNFTIQRFSTIMRDDFKVEIVAAKPEGAADFVPVLDGSVEFDPENPALLKAKIKPSTSLALQQYAALFAALDFNATSNRTFGDYFDYRLKGLDDAVLGDAPKVEFKSMSGVRTYVVADTADGMGITHKIAAKAAADVARRASLQAALTGLPVADDLKLAAIDLFAKAWEIGDGVPMPANIRDILNGNFDRNLMILRLIMGGWIEDAADDEARAKLEEISAALEDVLGQYEELATKRSEITDEIESIERDVTRAESDLINLKSIYTLFN